MKFPLQIIVRNSSLSEAAEIKIRRRTQKLELFCDRITGCRVMIETPHRHMHQAILYNIRIDLSVPGKKIVAKREKNEDIYVAIRDSFKVVRRQLQTYVHQQRGEVKNHGPYPGKLL